LSTRATSAVILAALCLCASAVAAASAPTPRMTYIKGLGSASPDVWVAGVDGSAATELGPASTAILSPDGASVATVTITKDQRTLGIDATAGGPPRVLSTSPQFIHPLDWSADSRLILLTVGESPAQLDVVDAASGQSLTIATGVIEGAGFSPGGSDQIVYARAAPNSASVNLYTTSSIGTNTRQLTHDGRSELPVWGVNGIVFSREYPRAKNVSPTLQLWFIKANGTAAKQLTHIPISSTLAGLTPIAFSGTGTHLLANLVGVAGTDHAEAYVVDLSTAKPAVRDLTGQSNGTIGDAISSDGHTVLLTKGASSNLAQQSIETVPWSGGKPTTIVPHGAYASWNR
jgi:hypothetical protein